MKIGLNEALTGFTREVTTLDNRKICITQLPGEFVQHEGREKKGRSYNSNVVLGLKVADGEGMPVHRDPFQKGALVIQFEVEYPDKEWFSNTENIAALSALLPNKEDQGNCYPSLFAFSKNNLAEVRDREEVMLQDFDAHLHSGRGRGGGRNAYDHGDDDDDEGMGGGGVRCQQQ